MRQSIDILSGLIPSEEGGNPPSREHLSRLYVFAIMWSLGALLELDDRKKVSSFEDTSVLY